MADNSRGVVDLIGAQGRGASEMASQAMVRTVVPASLVHVYIKDFGGNYAAAAEYANVGIQTLKRAAQSILIDDRYADALLKACYERLGTEVTNRILHPKDSGSGVAPGPIAPPAHVVLSAWGPVTIHDADPPVEMTMTLEPAPMKRCATCKQEFAPTLENFPANPNTKSGLQPWCRPCLTARARSQIGNALAANAAKRAAAKVNQTVTTAAASPATATWELLDVPVPTTPLSALLLALAADVEKLEQENTTLRAENAALAAQVAELKDKNASVWRALAALNEQGA